MADHGLTKQSLADAWDAFHAAQTEALGWMTNSERFKAEPQHRARAYHTMMEALAMAYNFAVAPRMAHPRLVVNTGWQTDIYTLGQNGPDLFYGVTFLDGRQTYRLSGQYNDSVLILCQVINHLSGHPDSKAIGSHDLSTFDIAEDGSFEFVLGGEEREGNWMPLDTNSRYNFLLFRRFTPDWNMKPADLKIARISEIPDDYYYDDEFDEDRMAERIGMATLFLKYLIRDFNMNLFEWYLGNSSKWVEDPTPGSPEPTGFNELAFLPGTITSEVGSSFSNYAMAIFDLKDDEALILELDQLPDGVYWSLQLGDVWSRSLNLFGQTSISMHHAAVDGDGGFRAVVSKYDPGVKNWLDTQGRKQGAIVFRNYRAQRQPVPASKLVKLSEVRDNLPEDTTLFTPEQRKEAVARRREGLLALHGE